MLASWHVLYQLAIYGSTLSTDTTGLLQQLATYSSIHCTDTRPAAPAHHLRQYTHWHNRFVAPTGHIQQYTLHWHNACYTSSPFLVAPYEVTQCLLHQLAIYGSTLWTDNRSVAPVGHLQHYTFHWHNMALVKNHVLYIGTCIPATLLIIKLK